MAASGGRLNWDAHSNLKTQYDTHGEILDQPVAGLLKDLKQRGLLDSTLVIFATEFGHMPMFQAVHLVVTTTLSVSHAGSQAAGVKKGFSFGSTDAFGFRAGEHTDGMIYTPPFFTCLACIIRN